jgi:hypothetical protein
VRARLEGPLDRWASTEVLAAVSNVEIAAAAGMDAPAARRLYEQTLGRPKAFGCAEARRPDRLLGRGLGQVRPS